MNYINKIKEFTDAINSYYGFALVTYPLLLFIVAHTKLFLVIAFIASLVMAGWGGFLLHGFWYRSRFRHGFRVISDAITYEIGKNKHYTLRHDTSIQSGVDHVMVYPIGGYQWSGTGTEGIPELGSQDQQLLSLVKNSTASPAPYIVSKVSTEGDWHYWFIAFDPPVNKGDLVRLHYALDFYDKQSTARPIFYYFVRTDMKKLVLNVKFSPKNLPKKVTCDFIKPSDPSKPFTNTGVLYEREKAWASWTIVNPKRGYCYRIHWQ